ncbi:thiamine-phosphate pyrophosphorylase [Lachnotalea glycerini]|uniref:Thiamine-phosphate synthase n=1 Tax=Lachnotalea glycerini TaxID=1763509 RepID=A0A318EJI9_9FIRM|nr:thiamine-phosphate pyrophosphorylase [Lachnotalea glycerini]
MAFRQNPCSRCRRGTQRWNHDGSVTGKELKYNNFLEEAFEIKALCKKYHVPFIINDDIEVALACDADGIHVGQHDMDILKVRERLGDDKLIGMSAQTVEQAKKAVESGADYLGVGAVFTTSTKPDADFVSYDTLKAICTVVDVPVCAIGGIYDFNINNLSGSGIDGVALISAIFAQDNIKKASERLFNCQRIW